MTMIVKTLIIYILISFGGVSAATDEAFENYIDLGIIPYETQIPWSADHYIERSSEEVIEEVVEEVIEEPVVVAGDLGILRIPDANIAVGLYSDGNAFQSSGKASVQYYIQYNVKWIADHVNQDGFWNLKNLSIGSKVYINDIEYTVTENIYAADYYTNFAAWKPYIEESVLVLQTCEGDGARLVRCQ